MSKKIKLITGTILMVLICALGGYVLAEFATPSSHNHSAAEDCYLSNGLDCEDY